MQKGKGDWAWMNKVMKASVNFGSVAGDREGGLYVLLQSEVSLSPDQDEQELY